MQSATRNKAKCYNKDVPNLSKLINLKRHGIAISISNKKEVSKFQTIKHPT
jgi:hypothetical protein